MQELMSLGLSVETIKAMIEINPYIKDMDKDEIIAKIKLLKSINCNDTQILNIISSNPMYLDSIDEDIIDLIGYLKHIGFTNLNILFESSPFILNLYSYEIEEYINKRTENNENIQDIVDDLETNTYLFDEI